MTPSARRRSASTRRASAGSSSTDVEVPTRTLAGGTDFNARRSRFFAKHALLVAARARRPLARRVRDDARVRARRARRSASRSATSRPSRSPSPIARWTSRRRARLVWRARRVAWDQQANDEKRGAPRAARSAVAFAHEAAMRCGDDGVQLHGGAGFMRDYPVEKFMRDAKQLALCGLTAEHADQLAAAVELGVADRSRRSSCRRPRRRTPSSDLRSTTMTIEFSLTQEAARDARRRSAASRRTSSARRASQWDREHEVPEEFLRNFVAHGRRRWARAGAAWGVRGLGDDDRGREEAPARRSKSSAMVTVRDRRRGARVGRRGASSLSARARASAVRPFAARARPSRRSASSAIFKDMSTRAAQVGRVRAHRAGRGERRRRHPHELPQGRQALGPERPQVLHHERRARVVDGDLRDGRSDARPRRASRVRRREGHARASASAGSKRRWASARARPRSSCSRTAASPRRTSSAARSGTSEGGLHDRHEDLRQHAPARRRDGDRHRPRRVRVRVRLREGELRRSRAPSRATRRSPSASRASAGASRRRARSPGARRGWPTTSMPNAKEASMSKALAGQAAIRACIEAIEICGAEGSIATRAPAPREVVPRHQGLRHLRGHRADPAHRHLEAALPRSQGVLSDNLS